MLLFFWIIVFVGAAAHRRQLVPPAVREETVGSERMTTATLWIGHSVRGECWDVLWSESGLPACLVCHCSLHSSNFSIENKEHMTFISVLFSLPSLSCAWTAIRRPHVRQAEWDSWKEYSSSITQTVGVYFSTGAQNSAVLHLSANGFLFIYLFSRFSDAAWHKLCTRSGNCLRLHRQQSTTFNRESEHAERSEVSNTPAL